MGLLWLKRQVEALRATSSRDKVNQNHYHTPGGIIVISAAIKDLTGVGVHNVSAFNAPHQPVEKKTGESWK